MSGAIQLSDQGIAFALDELADVKSQLDALNLQKQALIDSVITPEIKAKLSEIDIEFAGKSEHVQSSIADLEEQIKEAVKNFGISVKGKYLHAVFSKGRVSWDTKVLDKLATAHPEITVARNEGEPSVSLKAIR